MTGTTVAMTPTAAGQLTQWPTDPIGGRTGRPTSRGPSPWLAPIGPNQSRPDPTHTQICALGLQSRNKFDNNVEPFEHAVLMRVDTYTTKQWKKKIIYAWFSNAAKHLYTHNQKHTITAQYA